MSFSSYLHKLAYLTALILSFLISFFANAIE